MFTSRLDDRTADRYNKIVEPIIRILRVVAHPRDSFGCRFGLSK